MCDWEVYSSEQCYSKIFSLNSNAPKFFYLRQGNPSVFQNLEQILKSSSPNREQRSVIAWIFVMITRVWVSTSSNLCIYLALIYRSSVFIFHLCCIINIINSSVISLQSLFVALATSLIHQLSVFILHLCCVSNTAFGF